MSHHIKGQPRHQSTLFPEAIDDFVTEDNPVRVIDMFVDHLDLLDLGFEAVNAKLTGRLGYHPSTMLKLYIYGYLNRIQSSRRLEKESHRICGVSGSAGSEPMKNCNVQYPAFTII